jgi:quercetin dioxygenase-like cupin family protein
MKTSSLSALADQHLQSARASSAGRAAVTVYGGQQHDLRQTLVGMTAGTVLGEHQAPGEATIQVLQGSVTLRAGDEAWALATGDLGEIPSGRHDLAADEDAVVLLTVATDRTPPTRSAV